MKKTLFLILIAVFTLALASVAFAGGFGVHEGPGYPADTDACAGCHRAHTATSPATLANNSSKSALLTAGTTTQAFCYTCHGNGVLGANTDVEYGVYTSGRRDVGGSDPYGADNSANGATLNGGGFDYLGGTTTRPTDSEHVLEVSQTTWGEANGGPGTLMTLTCTNCHDPHGTDEYRVILADPDPDDVDTLSVVSNEGATPNYTTPNYKSGISPWCKDCHEQYMSSGDVYNAGDGYGPTTRYRHNIDVDISTWTYDKAGGLTSTLPLEDNNNLNCLTCHRAHGTDATMSGKSAGVGPTGGSALLRLNNRGVCQECHDK